MSLCRDGEAYRLHNEVDIEVAASVFVIDMVIMGVAPAKPFMGLPVISMKDENL